ncbi:hypothetical protein G6K88_07735 [Agrobacterium rhizogenes]|uniref:hypothetical protein n=1 Tax=Rhizobium rhizogenes TaxID=359 RepID=UPI0015725E24|nr:hypothetical protein [Rhizobium rhizogenes]NTF80850.1 hypothetical protein [Rhizobium rhizogenes]NTI01908.1 hypothetical protein [Rhizobium rhizogenes]NTI08711.1 hypothetical protein [Rhizobium rhizogenes]
MRRVFVAVFSLTALAATQAYSQLVMDQSGKSIPPELLTKFGASLIFATSDPFSAQLIMLKYGVKNQEDLCGLINTKNEYGAYVGFKPFHYRDTDHRIHIDDASTCD